MLRRSEFSPLRALASLPPALSDLPALAGLPLSAGLPALAGFAALSGLPAANAGLADITTAAVVIDAIGKEEIAKAAIRREADFFIERVLYHDCELRREYNNMAKL